MQTAAVARRRWDDQANVPDLRVDPIEYRPMPEALRR
jgi:hypothetical protein